MARAPVLLALVFVSSVNLSSRRVDEWPDPYGFWAIKVEKTDGKEMTDTRWLHLHNGEGDADDVTVQVSIDHLGFPTLISEAFLTESEVETELQLEVRYTVNGVVVSDWLDDYPYVFTLENDDVNLPAAGGIYKISIEARVLGAVVDPPVICTVAGQYGGDICHDRYDFKPYAAFLHLGGRVTEATTVPVIPQSGEEEVIYQLVDGTSTLLNTSFPTLTGYPALTTLTKWTATPIYSQTDLWSEMMQPANEQFAGQQMWWQEPSGTIDAGMLFVRSLEPKNGESWVRLWDNGGQVAESAHGFPGHRGKPVKDGPRGVGWTNGYIQGVCEDQAAEGEANVCFFMNISGQLRAMLPDGELVTIVGWRVPPGQGAIWQLKPMTSIRAGMEFRGTISSGSWAGDTIDPWCHQGMDVAVDPTDNTILYVACYYDNAIYKVVVNRSAWTGTVTLLAGSTSHTAGFVDSATATSVRFQHPFSLVCDLACDYLYVSDQGNDAIRKVNTTTGETTTFHNTVGLSADLNGDAGITCSVDEERLTCYSATAIRANAAVTVEGADYTIYFPGAIRIDSNGDLILWDFGLKTLRRIDVSDDEAFVIEGATADGKGALDDGAFGDNARGWVWLDVDRWGAVGPVDSVYWGNATSLTPAPDDDSGDRFNENYRYAKIDGTDSKWIFSDSHQKEPVGQGPANGVRPLHYPWGFMVDPNGALNLAGIGSHGIQRIRKRRSTDPVYATSIGYINDLKQLDWRRGTFLGGTRGDFYYNYTVRSEIDTATPLSVLYGWHFHNIIGQPDAWAVGPDSTDGYIDSVMNWPATIANDSQSLTTMRLLVRENAANYEAEESEPDPPPPATIRIPIRIRTVAHAWPAIPIGMIGMLCVTLLTRKDT